MIDICAILQIIDLFLNAKLLVKVPLQKTRTPCRHKKLTHDTKPKASFCQFNGF